MTHYQTQELLGELKDLLKVYDDPKLKELSYEISNQHAENLLSYKHLDNRRALETPLYRPIDELPRPGYIAGIENFMEEGDVWVLFVYDSNPGYAESRRLSTLSLVDQ